VTFALNSRIIFSFMRLTKLGCGCKSKLYSSLKSLFTLKKSLNEKEISVLEEDKNEDEDEDEDELLFLVLIINKLLFSIMLSFSLCLF
jgi:hypothetical protein